MRDPASFGAGGKKVGMRVLGAVGIFAFSAAAWAQSPDTSGNGQLKGTYYFQQLIVAAFDSYDDVTQVASLGGKIVFDGNGSYAITGQITDTGVASGQTKPLSVQGKYGIGSNGMGYLVNPYAPTDTTAYEFGAVGQGGVLVASSTEGNYDDLFVAIPAAATPLTNASFSGSYWMGLVDFSGGSESALKNALFKVSPDGKGSLGTVAVTGRTASSSTNVTQSFPNAAYSFAADGTATMTIPLPSSLTAASAVLSGTKNLYLSADGNYFIGGTPGGYDAFIGMRALSSTGSNASFQGLYFLGGFEDYYTLSDGTYGNGVDTFYGSLNSNGAGKQIYHERTNAPWLNYTTDYGIDDYETIGTDGTFANSSTFPSVIGAAGNGLLQTGTGGYFGLVFGVHAPSFSGSGVFLNPIGVTHAASYAPITARVAPGELLTLYGSGLASSTVLTAGGVPFPSQLGGVQVTINGTPAPIYYVSPGQISAVVPYGLSTSGTTAYAQIQVINNGAKSNVVTVYANTDNPGAFTSTQNGLGIVAALRQNGTVVSTANPAKQGEYVSLFLTGLGAVTPSVADGAIGPSSTLAWATESQNGVLAVYFNDYTNSVTGVSGTVTYAGLAPGLAGLYQMNVQIPTTVGPGNVYVEFSTDASDVNQAYIPVTN